MQNTINYIQKVLVLCALLIWLLPYTICSADETLGMELSDVQHETETVVEVSDIEIGNYETELMVNATMNLTATVLPVEATETKVTYRSSDNRVATVNSSGEVKGIAPGSVIIYVSCGKVTKEVHLTVKVETQMIKVDTNYKVLKVGENFKISATVVPQNANQTLQFKSENTQIATVSKKGVVLTKSSGSTAIIVSNGDMQTSVTLIVNDGGTESANQEEEKEQQAEKPNEQKKESYPNVVTVEEYGMITSDMLRYYYENKQVLTIKAKDYTIYIDGKDIINCDNTFATELIFQKDEKGTCFELNNRKNLCGAVTLDLSQVIENERYLYLYNQDKKQYQKVTVDDIKMLTLDTEGMYLLAEHKLSGLQIHLFWIILGVVVVVIGLGVYIVVKKKYWFW